MRIPKTLMPHQATLEAFAGSGPVGAVFDAPRVVRAYVEDKEQLVTDSAGAEVVSPTTVFLDPENFVPAGSMVTVWVGSPQERRAKVITAATFESLFLAQVQLLLE